MCGDDNTEVKIMQTSDYENTDLRRVIEGDRHGNEKENFGKHGFTKQEYNEDGELVDLEEEEDEFEDDEELNEILVEDDEIGRASCRERVSSPV